MTYIKKYFNLLTLLPLLLWAMVLGMGYSFVPVSYNGFLIGFLLLHILYAFFAVKFKSYAEKISKALGILTPVIMPAGTIILATVLETDGIYAKQSALCAAFILPVTVITSLVVFFAYAKREWVKIMVGITAGFILGIYFIICAGFLWSRWFVSFELTRSVTSPDGDYAIEIITYDEGAMGGSTKVCLKGTDEIFVGLGTLKERSHAIEHGRWAEEYEIIWTDNETFILNGEEYCVKEYITAP